MRWVFVLGCVLGAGCGGNDETQREASAVGGASAGSNGVAGSEATTRGGATAAGGSGEADEGGTTSLAGACTPVQRTNPPAEACPDWNTRPVGIEPGEPGVTVASVELPTTMVAGTPYALSMVTEAGSADVQLWGTDEVCGPSLESFPGPTGTTTRITPGVQCWELVPHSPHPYVLVIRRADSDYVPGDLHVCALGSCGGT